MKKKKWTCAIRQPLWPLLCGSQTGLSRLPLERSKLHPCFLEWKNFSCFRGHSKHGKRRQLGPFVRMNVPNCHLNRFPAHYVHQVARPESACKPGSHTVANRMEYDPISLRSILVQSQLFNGCRECARRFHIGCSVFLRKDIRIRCPALHHMEELRQWWDDRYRWNQGLLRCFVMSSEGYLGGLKIPRP